MSGIELCNLLVRAAKRYRTDAHASLKRNGHMHDLLPRDVGYVRQEVIDAVLVGFINDVAASGGIDLALYAIDLKTDAPAEAGA